MKEKFCSVVFDRKKTLERKGVGAVQIQIRLTHTVRKFVTIKSCTAIEWQKYSKSMELKALLREYEEVCRSMCRLGEDLTMENLNAHLSNDNDKIRGDKKDGSFIDFMREEIGREHIKENTRKQRMVAVRLLESFGEISTFRHLIPRKIQELDSWLRKQRTALGKLYDKTTIDNYHKRIHRYVRKAYEAEIIDRDPYDSVTLARGKNKERKPLLEHELVSLRDAEIRDKYLERVRDLFVFAAYTGLAYVDVMGFDFDTMDEVQGDMFYIDGKRTKTGSDFYTPILPPAMEVLKKYQFKLPIISNQKLNMYLHVLEKQLGIKKSISFHVARHTFATVVLSYNVPIDKVARMLGHKNIKTTQIYAKILKSSVQEQGSRLARMMM